MKRLGILICLVVVPTLIFGCSELSDCSTRTDTKARRADMISFHYVRDPQTHLCFAAFQTHLYTAVTCVPCDSLKNVLVGEISGN